MWQFYYKMQKLLQIATVKFHYVKFVPNKINVQMTYNNLLGVIRAKEFQIRLNTAKLNSPIIIYQG